MLRLRVLALGLVAVACTPAPTAGASAGDDAAVRDASCPLDSGVLERCQAGGSPCIVAGGLDVPWSIAVNSAGVYWTTLGIPEGTQGGSNGLVMSATLDGASITTIVSGQALPEGIGVDETSVYWTTRLGGAVMKAPLDGGAPVTLLTGQTGRRTRCRRHECLCDGRWRHCARPLGWRSRDNARVRADSRRSSR